MSHTELKQLYHSLESASTLLLNSGLRIAVAESCTGGLLGGALTDVSGSSAYMLGGVIAYGDSVKMSLLSVPAELIREHGAVSEQCARATARGVVSLLGSEIGVSITGISGPLGGSDAKPLGTTYVGLVAPDFEQVKHFAWKGDRAENRIRSVEAALCMVAEYLASRNNDLLKTKEQAIRDE
ncbi:MAG: CinA family protein [Chloroflexia bacterium]